MVDVATLALEARTEGLVKAEAALDRVTAAAIKTDAAADRMTAGAGRADAAVGQMGRSAGAAKAGFQNLGFQVQDFAVQVGSGTSASQALGQQLPQLLSGFGLLGGALGTAAAVLVPLIGHFMGASGGAASFTTALNALEDQLSETNTLAEIASGDLSSLIERFGALTPAIQALVATQADVSLRSMADAAKALNAELTAMYDGGSWFNNASRAEDLANGLRLGTDAANEMASALTLLSRAGSLDDQLALVTHMRERFVEMVGPVGQMTAAQFEFYQRVVDSEGALRATKRRADELANAAGVTAVNISSLRDRLNAAQAAGSLVMRGLYGARDGAVALVDAAPGGGWLSGAIGDASKLASTLWDAASAAAAAQFGGDDERGSQRPQVHSATGFTRDNPLAGGVGEGGGGGGSDGFQAKLDALTESLQTERDTTDAWYAESMTILEDRRAMELLGAQGHADALTQIEQTYQEKIAMINAQAQEQRISETAGLFGALAGIAQAGGAKMAKAAATFQAIEGTVNAYGAAIKALNTPGITLAGRFAAYASVLGAGLRGVAAIKSAGGAGSGGGASVGAAGGGASVGSSQVTAPSAPDRTIRVNVDGEGLFADMLRGSIRTIADALGEERNIGGFVVA